MTSALFRHSALMLVCVLLLMGLAPLSSAAQSDTDPAFVDAMDGSSALLTPQPLDETQVLQQYAFGQFQIQAFDPAFVGDIFSDIEIGSLGDSRTLVDAALDASSGASGQSVFVGCRSGDDNAGYAFRVQLDSGRISIWRFDAGGAVELESGDGLGVLNPIGEANRIGIECTGSSIAGILNGEVTITTSDSTYTAGASYLGAGSSPDAPSALLAAFDNLEVFDLLGATPEETEPQETPEAQTSGAIDPATLEAAVIDYALEVGPIAGPFVEDVSLSSGLMPVYPAGVDVTDFHTEVRFVVPAAPAGVWSVGFCFWVDPEFNCYDVFVHSDGVTAGWIYARTAATGESEVLDSGSIEGLDLTPGASNFIGLTVVGEQAVIIVNSADPRVSFGIEGGGSGDITRWLAFEAADPADTTAFLVPTDEFSVWDLSGLPALTDAAPAVEEESTPEPAETPEAEAVETPEEETPVPSPTVIADDSTPDAAAASDGEPAFDVSLGSEIDKTTSGSMEESDTKFDIVRKNGEVADFYATVTFIVPDEAPDAWDMTVVFRDQGTDDGYYRLTIFADDGTWTFLKGEDVVDSGEIEMLANEPGDEVRLELFADGETGAAALNGVEFVTFDLSELQDAGEVWITTASTIETTIDGRTIDYRDFSLFELE
ncbi:MAG: hypothetical protein IT335_10730 [Thermomicrobiales bacterium]|nr:hypothetical protein [Thermomicrobiales bacterium]